MHCGYIVKVKELKPHCNANKLQLATFFGETVCVGLDVKIGDIGIYFPCDLQLSIEYCDSNNLCRKKADGSEGSGYLDRDKRNITAIRLRGEKSFGLFMPLSSIEYTGVDIDTLNVGDTITVVNGHEICQKYIPHTNPRRIHEGGNRTRKKKVNIAPMFAEHADTEQLAYNLSAFRPGDEIEITLKMHGTSQRTAHLPVLVGYKKRKFWEWLLRLEKEPVYEYGYVSGTRRVVLENYDGGFYGDNSFREQHSKKFEGKLWAGETVYYEVVSYTSTGTPIMGECKTPKEAQDIYGKTTIFHYGIESPNSELYVYRMTLTTPDGNVVEYTPDFMRYRCEMMGVKTVPIMWKGVIPPDEWVEECYDCEGEWGLWRGTREETPGDWIKNKAEEYYDGPDPIGKTHVREGVVVRILNRPKFTAYKHKNFLFKQITGIIKEQTNSELSEDIMQEL